MPKTTELLNAILECDDQKVQCLLDAGVDPNTAGPSGNTPMRNAVQTENYAILDLLIENGADVNGRSNFLSPVDGRYEEQFTPIFYANSGDLIDYLVEKGAVVDARNADGETALLRACWWTFDDIISVIATLIKHGADVNVSAPIGKNGADMKPIDLANQRLKSYRRAQSRTQEEDYSNQIENSMKIINLLSSSGRT